ncbi:MAG: ABC transporter permease [Myxococcaceae bacterium]
MTTEPAQKVEAKTTGRPPRRPPPLWSLRGPISSGSSRLLGAASLGLVLITWCLCSYVTVDRTRVCPTGVSCVEGICVGAPGGGTVRCDAQPRLLPLVAHSFLPPPHEVVRSLLYLFIEQDLVGAIRTSFLRILLAFALSVAVAFPLGVLMGSFEAVNRFFDPIMAPLRYLPITAFIPLLILWFGIDETQKIAFLFLGTFVYLLPAVVDSVRAVPEDLVQTAYTLGASKVQTIRTVIIPAALPRIFDGFRVLNAIAWTYIILAEITNARSGIGYLLQLAQTHYKPAWSFAGIFVVGVIGLLTDLLIVGANRLIFPWREQDA